MSKKIKVTFPESLRYYAPAASPAFPGLSYGRVRIHPPKRPAPPPPTQFEKALEVVGNVVVGIIAAPFIVLFATPFIVLFAALLVAVPVLFVWGGISFIGAVCHGSPLACILLLWILFRRN
jgi:hypothetical protein